MSSVCTPHPVLVDLIQRILAKDDPESPRDGIDAKLLRQHADRLGELAVGMACSDGDLAQVVDQIHGSALGDALGMAVVRRLRVFHEKVLKKPFPGDEALACALLAPMHELPGGWMWNSDRFPRLANVRAALRVVDGTEIGAELRGHLQNIVNRYDEDETTPHHRRLQQDILSLLEGPKLVPLVADDAWASAVTAAITALPPAEQTQWGAFLTHARASRFNKPKAKWITAMEPLVQAIGQDVVLAMLQRHLGSLGRKTVNQNNSDILRGWLQSLWVVFGDDPRLLTVIVRLAEMGSRRAADEGLVCSKICKLGGVLLHACATPFAAGQLGLLNQRVKNPWAREELSGLFQECLQAGGWSEAEVLDLAVDDFGLDSQAKRLFDGGRDGSAELAILSSGKVAISWRNGAGKSLKQAPAALKRHHPEAIKELKSAQADIGRTLTAVKDRLDRCFRLDQRWSLAEWQQRYVNHPLTACIARGLLWRFFTEPGADQALVACLHPDGLLDLEGHAIQLDAVVEVGLWHPLDATGTDEVLAWRQRLAGWGISQWLKQSHRECYLLTPAEAETERYSNRFAGHVVRQHQFQALALSRGWQQELVGNWDYNQAGPSLDLGPDAGLQVEFLLEPIDADLYSDAGVSLYLSTDQLRFLNQDGPVRLADVPTRLLSEVMRDADLFVAVGSIGADPNWHDRGELPQFGDYWREASFGALGALANTRREVIAALVPKLQIADRCEVQDRFLRVRGQRHSYRIHFGSGNILIEPDERYLCIVADFAADEDLILPFMGDRTLSVILSKAMLLARDDEITDTTILAQL